MADTYTKEDDGTITKTNSIVERKEKAKKKKEGKA